MQRIQTLFRTPRRCGALVAIAATAALVATPMALAQTAGADPCPADLDNSGDVGFSDVIIVLSSYGENGNGDVDGDGDTDFNDLVAVLASWGPCPIDGPFITDFQPRAGGPGDLITAFGRGFGNDPDDLCMVAAGVGVRVLEVRDDRVIGVLLPFEGAPAPGPVMIAMGQGDRAIPGPDFKLPPQVEIQEPTWCWGQAPDGLVAAGPFAFEPVPGVGADQTFQSTLEDGTLVIDLSDADWQAGDKIRIVARLWCDLRHRDCTLPTMRFLAANPTPEQCATAICLLIQQAYAQVGDPIICTIEPGPRIRLSYPDCAVQPGISTSSLVARTACPIDGGGEPVELFDVIVDGPIEEGRVFSIIGRGFAGPLDLCVQFINGCSGVPLTVIGDRLIVEAGPVPDGAQPGPLMVARGRGTIVQPNQFFIPGIDVNGAPDGFQGNAGFPDDFVIDVPIPIGKPSEDTHRFVFNPQTRSLVAQIDSDWEPGDIIRLDVHFNVTLADGTQRHYDCFADDVQIPPAADPDPNACAQAICAIITQTFANQNPPVDVDCDVNGTTITVRTKALGQLKSGGGTVRRIPG